MRLPPHVASNLFSLNIWILYVYAEVLNFYLPIGQYHIYLGCRNEVGSRSDLLISPLGDGS